MPGYSYNKRKDFEHGDKILRLMLADVLCLLISLQNFVDMGV